MIVGLHHVSISVSDLDRALDFYRDVLGFEEVQRSVFSGDAPLADRAIRLVEAGMTFVGPPVDFGRSAAIYGRDPFGNVIELYEIRDPAIAQLPSSAG
jgi:catechol 2,3-dioxygenase-like lactoylglutathione lyase family enzyme